MDKKSKVISNLIWRFFERFGAQAVSIVVSIILARKLGPGPAGDIAVIMAVITILKVFADSGMGNALIQKKDTDDLDYSSVFFEPLVGRQGSRVSMRVARASASLLSSHGRVPGTSPG